MFLDSASEENLANPQCAMEPLAGEATITINWELPLNGKSQEALFMRINIAYQKATALVGDVRDKKRYRMKAEEMVSLRNLVAFYFQVRDFCSTRIKDFDAFEKRFLSGPGCDHQFHEVLDQRPAQFAISMLPSAKVMAAEEVREQQESSCLEVDKQRVEVRQARWKYFVAALQRDQQQLQQVLAAPLKLEALRHRKEMQWRMEQAKMGGEDCSFLLLKVPPLPCCQANGAHARASSQLPRLHCSWLCQLQLAFSFDMLYFDNAFPPCFQISPLFHSLHLCG